jgi:membrane-associated PAP2 superfamily phosphatase
MRCAPLLERLGAPFFGCLLLAAITHLTGLDQTFSQLFYDPDAGLFPMRHSFLMETVMHEWARYLTFGFALLVLAAIPVMPGKSPRRAALFTFLSMVLTSTLIALIKRQSDVTCPWDLTQFGGDGAGGQCWPSGHASVGFSLLAVYFAAEWLGYSWARLACWLAALFGILLTLSQTARGAHFLTHGLWTGLLIWLANVALATLFLPRTRP